VSLSVSGLVRKLVVDQNNNNNQFQREVPTRTSSVSGSLLAPWTCLRTALTLSAKTVVERRSCKGSSSRWISVFCVQSALRVTNRWGGEQRVST
jgi:hypothetical protein